MSFEEVLANCLAELELGKSVDACLAQYPLHAAELAPILRMITPMRSGPKPQLSLRAFARGRATVAAYARQQQKLREPFTAAAPRAAQIRPFYVPATAVPSAHVLPAKPTVPPMPPRGFLYTQRLLYPIIAAVLVITCVVLVRGAVTSLPGSLLYPVKSWGENAQGLLMQAAGQQASWHVNQMERRLTELALLAQRGTAIDPALAGAVDDHLQAALDATATMTAEQRTQFLGNWLGRLHTLRQNLPAQETTLATLSRAMITVEAAAQRATAPTILLAEDTPTTVPVFTPIATPTPTSFLPTVTPTDTDIPLPTAALDTPTLAPVETGTVLIDTNTPTTTPAPLATVPVSAPTVTETLQLIPEESNAVVEPIAPSDEESSHKKATATPVVTPEETTLATPLVTIQPPHIPLPTTIETPDPAQTPDATPTSGDETRATATPETNQTPIPGGIPTSAEPPTPTPKETAKNTPTPTKQPDPTATEKIGVPTATRVENKTPTPEATKADNNSPTNTPKPEETKVQPPTPDSASATPKPTDSDENADPGQSTAEPTPTPKKKKK